MYVYIYEYKKHYIHAYYTGIGHRQSELSDFGESEAEATTRNYLLHTLNRMLNEIRLQVYVCVSSCVCIYTYTCVYIHTLNRMLNEIRLQVRMCVCVSSCVCIHTCMCS